MQFIKVTPVAESSSHLPPKSLLLRPGDITSIEERHGKDSADSSRVPATVAPTEIYYPGYEVLYVKESLSEIENAISRCSPIMEEGRDADLFSAVTDDSSLRYEMSSIQDLAINIVGEAKSMILTLTDTVKSLAGEESEIKHIEELLMKISIFDNYLLNRPGFARDLMSPPVMESEAVQHILSNRDFDKWYQGDTRNAIEQSMLSKLDAHATNTTRENFLTDLRIYLRSAFDA